MVKMARYVSFSTTEHPARSERTLEVRTESQIGPTGASSSQEDPLLQARHTFCTLGRQAGIAPEAMQRLMRHKDIRTTLEIYSHVTENEAASIIEGSKLLPDGVAHSREAQTVQ